MLKVIVVVVQWNLLNNGWLEKRVGFWRGCVAVVTGINYSIIISSMGLEEEVAAAAVSITKWEWEVEIGPLLVIVEANKRNSRRSRRASCYGFHFLSVWFLITRTACAASALMPPARWWWFSLLPIVVSGAVSQSQPTSFQICVNPYS